MSHVCRWHTQLLVALLLKETCCQCLRALRAQTERIHDVMLDSVIHWSEAACPSDTTSPARQHLRHSHRPRARGVSAV